MFREKFSSTDPKQESMGMNLCGVILSVVRCGVDTMASLNQGFDPIGAELFMVRCATYYMFLNLTLCPFQ